MEQQCIYSTAFMGWIAVGLLLTVTLQLVIGSSLRPTDLLIMLATFVAVTSCMFRW